MQNIKATSLISQQANYNSSTIRLGGKLNKIYS